MAGTPSYLMFRTDQYLVEYLKSRNEHFKILKQQYLYLIGFKAIIAMALLVIGGVLVINQTMNIGQFVAAEIIILLILSSVEKLIVSLETVYDLLTAIEKIGQVTDLPLEHKSGMEIPANDQGFEIDLVNISYTSEITSQILLEDVSFTAKPNEIILFKTDNSVSTNLIFGLIGGMYQPVAGNLSINNIPLGNLNRVFLRNRIGNMLSQDLLIHATVLENITLGRDYVSFGEVQQLCDRLNLSKQIQFLKEGYDTLLNPEGHFLPKDCIRKILLARALVGSPKLVLLEEPLHDICLEDRQTIIDIIGTFNQTTFLIQSDEPALAPLAGRTITLTHGRIN
jgi:ABC-type bacteriocin/lantibiotic exporter with double-glycine peptidase domain